jgi:hypothetical protein
MMADWLSAETPGGRHGKPPKNGVTKMQKVHAIPHHENEADFYTCRAYVEAATLLQQTGTTSTSTHRFFWACPTSASALFCWDMRASIVR